MPQISLEISDDKSIRNTLSIYIQNLMNGSGEFLINIVASQTLIRCERIKNHNCTESLKHVDFTGRSYVIFPQNVIKVRTL